MDSEDRLEQRVTPSRLTDRWDSVCKLVEQAPDALFLLDPEPEAIPQVDRHACRLLAYSGEGLAPPAAPRDPSESVASFPCVHACDSSGLKPTALGPLLR